MKALKNTALLFAFVVSFASCGTFNDEDILTMENIENELVNNEWKVSYYLNNNIIETPEFEDFILTFKQNGELVANKPFVEIKGRWVEDKVTKEIILSFEQNTAPFSKISETWRLSKREDKAFQFVNISETELVKITHN